MEIYFSQFWRLRSLSSSYQLLLSWRELSSLPPSFSLCSEAEGLTLMTSSKQFLPKGPSPVTITSEVKVSTQEFVGRRQFNPYNMLRVAEGIAQLGREGSHNGQGGGWGGGAKNTKSQETGKRKVGPEAQSTRRI